MSTSGLKAIAPVPTATDFLDIVLSKTQRKTPTVCLSARSNYAEEISMFYRSSTKTSKSAGYVTFTCEKSSLHRTLSMKNWVRSLTNFRCLMCAPYMKISIGQIWPRYTGSASIPCISHECIVRQEPLQASLGSTKDLSPSDRPSRKRLCPST